jgi:hypothetical protein
MQKSIILRNFRICLLFWPLTGLTSPVSAQDRPSFFSNRSDHSEDDDFSDRSSRDWRSFRRDDSSGEGFSSRDRFRGMDSRRGDFRGGDFRDGGDFEGRSFGRFGSSGGDFGGFHSRDRGDMYEDGTSGTRSDLKPRVRITVDLPASFTAGDLDGDGQIGLYEWKQWRRGDLAGFQSYDHNGDGFLTPAELTRGPLSPVAAAGDSGTGASSRSTTLTSGPAPAGTAMGPVTGPATGTGASTTSAPATAGGDTTALSNQAQSLFRLMDRNRDGTLDTEEWAKATKLKARFEAAKIDVGTPMPRDAFIEHFVHLPPSSS